MPYSQLLTNIQLLNPLSNDIQPSGIIINDLGIIEDIGSHLNQCFKHERHKVINGNNHIVSTPLIDAKVNMAPTLFHTASTSFLHLAHQSGIGAIMVAPTHDHIIDTIDKAKSVYVPSHHQCHIHYYGSLSRQCEGNILSEIGLMTRYGIKSFTDGHNPVSDTNFMMNVLRYCKNFEALCVQTPLLQSQRGQMNQGEIADRMGLVGSHPVYEKILLQRDISLLQEVGGRYHASLITTKEGVDIIRQAKKQGLHITADTAPQYFSFSSEAIGNYKTYYKLTPPLRHYDDIMAIKEGLKDGTIDCILSDHTPLHDDSKRVPYESAQYGMALMELLLPLSLNLVAEGYLTLPQLLQKLTINPARIFGLPPEYATIEKNQTAHLLLFDPETPSLWQRSEYSPTNIPMEQYPIIGKVHQLWINGKALL